MNDKSQREIYRAADFGSYRFVVFQYGKGDYQIVVSYEGISRTRTVLDTYATKRDRAEGECNGLRAAVAAGWDPIHIHGLLEACRRLRTYMRDDSDLSVPPQDLIINALVGARLGGDEEVEAFAKGLLRTDVEGVADLSNG